MDSAPPPLDIFLLLFTFSVDKDEEEPAALTIAIKLIIAPTAWKNNELLDEELQCFGVVISVVAVLWLNPGRLGNMLVCLCESSTNALPLHLKLCSITGFFS